jgi:alkylation response protein AidB-like acyl-CoA dehydrogenase
LPVLAHGSAALCAEVIPPVLRGEQIAALAITEPGGGSTWRPCAARPGATAGTM